MNNMLGENECNFSSEVGHGQAVGWIHGKYNFEQNLTLNCDDPETELDPMALWRGIGGFICALEVLTLHILMPLVPTLIKLFNA